MTGGAGFIGSHVVDQLVTTGADVQVVDDLSKGRREYVPDPVKLHPLSVLDDGLDDICQSFDPTRIIHLAAIHYIPYCNQNPEETVEANVYGTRQLLNTARRLDNLDSVVFTSSAAVYPPREKPNPVTSTTGPVDIYGTTKLLGEDLLQLFHAETGVRSISARLFNVYGPRETNPHLIPEIIEQVRDGANTIKLGNLTPRRDFIYVNDVAEALLELAAGADIYRAYNVGSGTTYSVHEVAELIGEVMGKDLTICQETDRTRESDRPHLEADISRIRSEVGWEPTVDFPAGLRLLLQTQHDNPKD